MGTIPQATLEDIKSRIDLADVISSCGVSLKRAGGDFVACCPFHNEKTPSFHVHPDKGFYHCFGCGKSGDAITFLVEHNGMNFMDAVKQLAGQCGVKIEEEREDPEAKLRSRLFALHAELSMFFRRCLLRTAEAETARRYLATRRLPEEALEKFAVGYAPSAPETMLKWAEKYGFTLDEMDAAGVLLKSKYAGGRPYNRFGGRLMFTICDRQGRPCGFSGRILQLEKSPKKYVNSPETAIFKKKHVLFGFDKASRAISKNARREVIVCEGQIDLIRCHASGFDNAVASQGTAFTREQVAMIRRCADSVLLVFDADGAGTKAAISSGGLCLEAGMPVRVATLPEGEDPDSLLRDQGVEAFQRCLDASESITSFQVRVMRSRERAPDSIDAVKRVSRAALDTIKMCSSEVIKSALLKEASNLIGVPVAALEADMSEEHFSKAETPRPRPAAAAPVPTPTPTVRSDAVGHDMPPPEFFDEGRGDGVPAQFDAAAPVNNPPPPREFALCELLMDNADDAEVREMVEKYLPDEVLSHEFTRAYVAAWRRGGVDALADLRRDLGIAECGWLDRVLLAAERGSLSELSPARIMQDVLRQLWMAEYRRRQGMLSAASNPENDMRRLSYSTAMRRVQSVRWPDVAALMNVARLQI